MQANDTAVATWADAPAGDEIEDAIDRMWFAPAICEWHPDRREPGQRRKGDRYSRDIRAALRALDMFTSFGPGYFSLTCDKSRRPWYSCEISGDEWSSRCEGQADSIALAAARAMLDGYNRDGSKS